jgi:Skp family chaperone for outer membrane proteins
MAEESTTSHGLTLDQKTIDVLVANIIPTSKYFESRFDHLQYQVDELKSGQKNLLDTFETRFSSMQTDMDKRFTTMQTDMDKRFTTMQTDMDKRFEQVDKRFEQVDKRFEQVDKRFQPIEDKLDKILERIDRRIDDGLRENRAQAMRMFTFAMTFSAISMIGLVGKMFKLF